jgi:hypothetical protein
MATRNELLVTIGPRYRAALKSEKGKILDEFVKVTGFHRKHAIRALSARPRASFDKGARRRRYGGVVKDALIKIWETSDRMCGKRLKPVIPVYLAALERWKAVDLTPDARDLLLSISPAAIDRLLEDVRLTASGGRRRRAGFASAVRRSVPIRTFNDWRDPAPGFMEVDMVAHGGPSSAGSFCWTIVFTDIATGWTETLALIVRESAFVLEAIKQLQAVLPFPVKGLDFDNDSAFMNEDVVGYCRSLGIEVTRSRAYKKNDQAHVEQKNGAVVRRLVGYGRLSGLPAAQALSRLYAAARLHVNLFQPSFKLKSKTRIGAQVKKRYDGPKTPCDRALADPRLDPVSRRRIIAMRARVDPVSLMAEIRDVQSELGERIPHRPSLAPKREHHDTDRIAAALGAAWRAGERPPNRKGKRAYVRVQPWPERACAKHTDQIAAWLDAEPHLSGPELLKRLDALEPGRFGSSRLRMIQRELRRWRLAAIRAVLDEVIAPADSRFSGPHEGRRNARASSDAR